MDGVLSRVPGTHIVAQGECLASLALKYDLGWRTIYFHPDNAELRRNRPDPNVLCPGDSVVIPDRSPKEIDRPTDARHRFVVESRVVHVRIRLHDKDGNPFANSQYKLRAGSIEQEGVTGADGLLEAPIPADLASACLQAWLRTSPDDPEEEYEWSLELGTLDPVDEISGVQARLNNLGFLCGAVDGIVGPRTRAALREFQSNAGLEATGEPDTNTRSRLRERHDGM